MTGLVGAAIATTASAADLTAQQKQTIAISKRQEPAAKSGSIATQSVTLGGIKTGAAFVPTTEAALPALPQQPPISPLSGLSLHNLSLSPPAGGPTAPSAAASSPSALTEQNGSIRYSVAPESGFTPYIGLGPGRAAGMLGSGMSPSNVDGSDGLHSYQGVAGFAYKLDKDTRLDLDYRMSNTQRPNVPMLDNATMADSERDRAAMLSLHYDLDPVLRRPPK